MKRKRWYDYLWVSSSIYLALGFMGYCPIGTMTQGICKIKHRREKTGGGKGETNSGASKILANENRLMILCALMEWPLTVNKISKKMPNIIQSASIADHRVEEIINTIKKYYCEGDQ